MLAGAAAMLGHWRPVFLGFQRGGKMVATAGGAFLGVAPLVGFSAAGVWLVVFGLTRYASVASITAAASLGALGVVLRLPVAGDRVRRGGRRWVLPSSTGRTSRGSHGGGEPLRAEAAEG